MLGCYAIPLKTYREQIIQFKLVKVKTLYYERKTRNRAYRKN